MKYIYAALLLYESGKEINEENLKRVLNAVGENPEPGMLKSLVTALNSINIKEVLESALAMAPAAAPPAAPTEEAKEEKVEEEKKEEKKEEEKEEEALEGLGALFG